MTTPFTTGQWIEAPTTNSNDYTLFYQHIETDKPFEKVTLRFSASYLAEIYINGQFARRGPIPGDPHWCHYEQWTQLFDQPQSSFQLCAVVHHSDIIILNQLPAPKGFIAEIEIDGKTWGTGTDWYCRKLEMWQQNVPKRSWALDYLEAYDARQEPPHWESKTFPKNELQNWQRPCLIENAHTIWQNYQPRVIAPLERHLTPGQTVTTYNASPTDIVPNDALVQHTDTEPLELIDADQPVNWENLSDKLLQNNALTFDLGRECVGYYYLELHAPQGVTIDISAAENLHPDDQRGWFWRRDVHTGARYITKDGRQIFRSFTWNGFRYLHLVFRGPAQAIQQCRLITAGCLEKRAPFKQLPSPTNLTSDIKKIYDLCCYTLKVGVQEHLIDCPTREQLQYWADAIFIADALVYIFDEQRYLEWYLESFIHVPFYETGLFSSVYPGDHGNTSLVDYNIIPALGQDFYHHHNGRYYNPKPWIEKALQLNQWFEKHLNDAGLISFDYDRYVEEYRIRNFIDHPGIGWHDFDHIGIDRQGTSAPLNAFYYGFIRTLRHMAQETNQQELSLRLVKQEDTLKKQLLQTFYDNDVFHDTINDGVLSAGTSWQTNSLMVFFDIVDKNTGIKIMTNMLNGYDHLCRCTPYFHFYFLDALGKLGMIDQALDLIKRLWQPMLEKNATTTWETFKGNHRDSLCHPWSTAPALFIKKYM